MSLKLSIEKRNQYTLLATGDPVTLINRNNKRNITYLLFLKQTYLLKKHRKTM